MSTLKFGIVIGACCLVCAAIHLMIFTGRAIGVARMRSREGWEF